MKASEPAIAYSYKNVQSEQHLRDLKERLVAAIEATDDKWKLEQCLEVLCADKMPCVFTDEEFAEELRLSEASGFVSQEEALKEFAKWGFVR